MTEGPVTIGDLRREGKRLHIYCTECKHEREVDVMKLPFDALPAALPVLSAAGRLKCSKCGVTGKIWTAPEIPEASPEAKRRWGAPDDAAGNALLRMTAKLEGSEGLDAMQAATSRTTI